MARSGVTIRRFKTQFLLVLSWAVLSALAYPRPNIWLLSHVSLVPLVLLGLRGAPRRRVIGLTYIVSTLWWGGMLYWLFPVTGLGTAGLAAYMALFPVAFVAVLPWIQRR